MNPTLALIYLCLTVLTGCGLSGTTPEEILAAPAEFHGRDVTVEGRIGNLRALPELGVFGYTLSSGADSLSVLDPERPTIHDGSVQVTGRVHMRFVVDGRARVVLLRGLDR